MDLKIRPLGRDGINAIVGFHDGVLSGVRCEEFTLSLWSSTADGIPYHILVPRTERLLLSDFTGGNTINSMLLYPAVAAPKELFARICLLDPTQLEGDFAPSFASFRKSALSLLEVATSDGCLLLALSSCPADAIRILPVPKKGPTHNIVR